MRKLFFALLLITISIATYAQSTLFGVNANFNTTWLLNKNINESGSWINPEASFANAIGLQGGYLFGKSTAIKLELNTFTVRQKYNGEFKFANNVSVNYKGEDKVKFYDIPLMFQISNNGGMYFEFGPRMMIVRSSLGSIDPVQPLTYEYNARNISHQFHKTIFGVAAGLGINIKTSERIVINAGVRFTRSLSDVTREMDKSELFDGFYNEQNNNENLIGLTGLYSHYNKDFEFEYAPTTLFTGGIMFGVSMNIATKKKEEKKPVE